MDSEGKRQAKRQKTNTRKWKRLAVLNESKLSHALCQAVQTDLPFKHLRQSKQSRKSLVPNIEELRLRGYSVIPWDGM